MNGINAQTWLIVGGVAALVLIIAIAGWLLYQRQQSRRLQQRFGSEYGRTVSELGNRPKAEAELRAREKRVDRLHIVALEPPDAARFSQAWQALQARFVDDPKGVVVQADQLVRAVMAKRGYPVGDFERRAADISVDHPDVVANYRAAQAIVTRTRDEASTEDLRKALVHYRALFDELLEVSDAKAQAMPREQLEVRS
jgi:hypothetical protein